MKIAIFDNLPEGGAKRVLFEQVKYLAKNHSIDWYTNQQETIFPIALFVKNKFQFDLNLAEYKSITRPLKELSLLTHINLVYRQIAHQINKSSCDAVLIHPCQLTQAPWLLQFLRKPSLYFMEEMLRVFYEPELFSFNNLSVHKRWYERTRRSMVAQIDYKSVQLASKLMVSSKYVLAQLQKVYGRVATINHLAADTTVFKPDRRKQPKQFLFIGDKSSVNGYPLLKNCKQSMEHKFIIKYLQFGRQKKFKLSDHQVAKLYQESYATLCLSFNEPFGLSALESMACGTTVIAVNSGGYKETIEDKCTGLLIDRDSSQLYQAMETLVKNKKFRLQLEENGLAKVSQKFTWQIHGKRLEEQLLALCDG